METKCKSIAKAVMISVVAASLAGVTIAATAASKHVKCYGIAEKGKNDCGTARHSCAGQAKQSYSSQEWKYASKSKCLKKGGSIGKPKKY